MLTQQQEQQCVCVHRTMSCCSIFSGPKTLICLILLTASFMLFLGNGVTDIGQLIRPNHSEGASGNKTSFGIFKDRIRYLFFNGTDVSFAPWSGPNDNKTEVGEPCVPFDPIGQSSVVEVNNNSLAGSTGCLGSKYTRVTEVGTVQYVSEEVAGEVKCCLKVKVKVKARAKKKKKPKQEFEDVCRPIPPSKGLKVNRTEFLEINCTHNDGSFLNRTEYHQRFRPKPIPEQKHRLWLNSARNIGMKKLDEHEQPPSILIVGLSSVSKSQAQKDLPQTTELLLSELGFLSYEKYISGGDGIPGNFLPMLTSFSMEKYLEKEYTKPTVLSHTFNRLKYVTFGGVHEVSMELDPLHNPADYTINSLLEAYHWGMTRKPQSCFQHNLLQDIFGFTSRFLQQYKSVPYFAHLWLDLFNKQVPEALQTADSILHAFFEANKADLSNTLVILVSDEGSHNLTDFQGQGYFANNFPFLYVHFPVSVQNSTGGYYSNQNVTISAGDIRSTLEYVAFKACRLKGLNPEVLKYCRRLKPTAGSGAALWSPIPYRRSSSELGISANTNACSARPESLQVEPLGPDLALNVAQFLLNFINQYIEEAFVTKVRVNCHHWVLDLDGVVFSSVLYRKAAEQDVLIQIRAQPDRPNPEFGNTITKFEAVVRLSGVKGQEEEGAYEMSVQGFPKRVPEQGEFPGKYKCIKARRAFRLQALCNCKPKPLFKFKGHGKPDY